MAKGDTITRRPGDQGVPMIEGDPSEPVGPEDAAGLGVKRGDYSGRTDHPDKPHYEYGRDDEGNLEIRDQTALMLEGDQGVPENGTKGGVDSAQTASTDADASTEDQPNEVQVITVNGDDGTFKLAVTVDGDTQTTGDLDYAEGALDAATVEAAIEGLSNVPANEATTTGAAGGPYTVTFSGTLGDKNIDQIEPTDVALTGDDPTVVVTTTEQGS